MLINRPNALDVYSYRSGGVHQLFLWDYSALGGTGNEIATGIVLSPGATFHFVINVGGGTATVFVNGAQAWTGPYAVQNAATGPFRAGADENGNQWNGTIDEVAFYTGVHILTPTQTAAHYQAMIGTAPPPPPPPSAGIYHGAFVDGDTLQLRFPAGGYSNLDVPDDPGATNQTKFETDVGKTLAVVLFSLGDISQKAFWNTATTFAQLQTKLDTCHSRGMYPVVDATTGGFTDNITLGAVAAGTYDTAITSWFSASGIGSYTKPWVMRLDVEMNLYDQYQYSFKPDGRNGATRAIHAANFKAAWQRIHDLATTGANAGLNQNISWHWAPNAVAPWDDGTGSIYDYFESYYPGDAYVDWAGIVCYQHSKTGVSEGDWWYMSGPAYRRCLAVAPTKPIMVSEWSSYAEFTSVLPPDSTGSHGTDTSKGAWLQHALDYVRTNQPAIKAMLIFNVADHVSEMVDNDVWSSGTLLTSPTLAGYRAGIANAAYLGKQATATTGKLPVPGAPAPPPSGQYTLGSNTLGSGSIGSRTGTGGVSTGGTFGSGQFGSGSFGSRGTTVIAAGSGTVTILVTQTGTGAPVGGVITDSGTATAAVAPSGVGAPFGGVVTDSGAAAITVTPSGVGAATGPPANVTPPTLPPGSPAVNQILTVNPGVWVPSAVSYTYQWQRADNQAGLNLANIGAPQGTAASYAVTSADRGKFLRVLVTAQVGGGTVASNYTGQVMTALTGVVKGSYDARISWDAVISGVFRLDSSLIGGPDVLGASSFSASFAGTWDSMNANGLRIDEIAITRGRGDDLSQVTSGSCELTVIDPVGLLNPSNPASPLYGNLIPQRPCRVTVTYGGITKPLYYGFVRTIEYDPGVRVGTARLELNDLFQWLAAPRDTTDTGGGAPKPVIGRRTPSTTGAAIGLILDAVGWTDAAMRLLDTGDDIPYFEAVGDQEPLQLIADLVAANGGIFYIDATGRAVFEDRNTRWGRASYASLTDEMQVVLPGVNLDSVTNIWTAVAQYEAVPGDPSSLTDGPVQTADDATSKNLYGYRDQAISSKYFLNDGYAAGAAAWRLSRTKSPVGTVWGLNIDNRDDQQMQMIVGAEIHNRITINETRTGVTGDFFIEQITHTISRKDGSHKCGLLLSVRDPAGKTFQLDVDTLGGPAVLGF